MVKKNRRGGSDPQRNGKLYTNYAIIVIASWMFQFVDNVCDTRLNRSITSFQI